LASFVILIQKSQDSSKLIWLEARLCQLGVASFFLCIE